MLRPTLVIGIGSSGLRIVEHVQKQMYETLGLNSLPIFKYIYIETDHDNEVEPTPLGSDIVPVRSYISHLRASIEKLSFNRNLKLDWIPKNIDAELSSINAGAGGVRPGGRLALWGEENFDKIYKQIENAYTEIMKPSSRDKISTEILKKGEYNPIPVVYVTGTMCGGTNAGMFIDIGYMIRQICGLKDGGALYGIFLMPPDGQKFPSGYGNCHGALQELEFFRDPKYRYEENWPNGVPGYSHLPPYGIVYLASQEYGDPTLAKLNSLDGLYRIVGLQIFSNLLGMSGHRTSVLVDGLNAGFGFYSTFGISAITYPKYAISEYTACEVGQQLCNRWLDQYNYKDANGTIHNINEAVVKGLANDFFDTILEQSFENLESRGIIQAGLLDEINEDVNKIIKGEIDSVTRYLHNKFSSGTKDSFYAVVKGNLKSARDFLIESITNEIESKFDNAQNIRYAELFTIGINERIDETFKLWENLKIPKEPNQWNTLCTSELSRLTSSSGNLLLQKFETLQDRLINLLNLLKMFLMREVLNEFHLNISSGTMVSSRDLSKKLLTVSYFKNYRNNVKELFDNFDKRKEKISVEINDDTLPIFKIWREGSFKKDCESTMSMYSHQKPTPPHSKDISPENLSKMLDLGKDKDVGKLAEKIKTTYQKEIIPVIPPVNVLDEAKRKIDQTKEYAKRAICGLLRLDHGGQSGPGVPRFIIGNNKDSLDDLVSALNNAGYSEYTTKSTRDIAFLDQMILFYEEKAQVNPHEDLSVRKTLKRNFESPPSDPTGKAVMDEEIWQSFRLAYSIDRRKREQAGFKRLDYAKNLMQFVLDFFIEWQENEFNEWNPIKVRSEFETENLTIKQIPIYKISPPGQSVYYLKLDPEDDKTVKELAESDKNFKTFELEIIKLTKKHSKAKLLSMFNETVQPYLIKRFNHDLANKRGKVYFGGDAEKGLIEELIIGSNKGDKK